MAIKGIGASLWLTSGATSPLVLTDVSTYLDKIDGTSTTDKLDGTTFQPDVAHPIKVEIPGLTLRGLNLSGKWTAAAEAFFAGIEGLQNLEYQYGPTGTSAGSKKIYGHCNCFSYTGPQSSVAGITTFSVELTVTSRNVGTF